MRKNTLHVYTYIYAGRAAGCMGSEMFDTGTYANHKNNKTGAEVLHPKRVGFFFYFLHVHKKKKTKNRTFILCICLRILQTIRHVDTRGYRISHKYIYIYTFTRIFIRIKGKGKGHANKIVQQKKKNQVSDFAVYIIYNIYYTHVIRVNSSLQLLHIHHIHHIIIVSTFRTE